MSYLIAAYAVVLVTLAGYALRLRARRRSLLEELTSPPRD
jgi:CcmD family protein